MDHLLKTSIRPWFEGSKESHQSEKVLQSNMAVSSLCLRIQIKNRITRIVRWVFLIVLCIISWMPILSHCRSCFFLDTEHSSPRNRPSYLHPMSFPIPINTCIFPLYFWEVTFFLSYYESCLQNNNNHQIRSATLYRGISRHFPVASLADNNFWQTVKNLSNSEKRETFTSVY